VIVWGLFAAALLGAWVYCLLAILAAARYALVRRPAPGDRPPVSILKPLSGFDEGLEENLRSFFELDYPEYEILFAVRHETDAALPAVRNLCAEYPEIPTRVLVVGEPAYPHGKVYSLARMLKEARHELIVMSDSDIRVGADLLQVMAAEFTDPHLGVSTCPYRAIAGRSIWSRLEAAGMNTTFFQGVLTARMLEGMKFAIGPTLAVRRKALEAIGGLESVKDFLSSEDFELGKLVAKAGFGVILSSYVVEHRIGAATMRQNFAHRMRWGRTSRRSRPAGYIGQFFTFPIPIALLLLCIRPEWHLLLGTLIIRYAAGWIVSEVVLGARMNWILVPVEDILSFVFWIAGFFGNSIAWRGRTFLLDRKGRIAL
jgi:ceramide glucosyltransferase